jgi:hypothetical protein
MGAAVPLEQQQEQDELAPDVLAISPYFSFTTSLISSSLFIDVFSAQS